MRHRYTPRFCKKEIKEIDARPGEEVSLSCGEDTFSFDGSTLGIPASTPEWFLNDIMIGLTNGCLLRFLVYLKTIWRSFGGSILPAAPKTVVRELWNHPDHSKSCYLVFREGTFSQLELLPSAQVFKTIWPSISHLPITTEDTHQGNHISYLQAIESLLGAIEGNVSRYQCFFYEAGCGPDQIAVP